jgi:hypothetical protein
MGRGLQGWPGFAVEGRMIETAQLLRDIPLGDAFSFAFTMALVVAFSYVIICGTGRPR